MYYWHTNKVIIIIIWHLDFYKYLCKRGEARGTFIFRGLMSWLIGIKQGVGGDEGRVGGDCGRGGWGIKLDFTVSSFYILWINNLFYSKGVLRNIIDAATADTTARTLCQMGDSLIEEETSRVYKKEKELKKGIPCLERVYSGIPISQTSKGNKNREFKISG